VRAILLPSSMMSCLRGFKQNKCLLLIAYLNALRACPWRPD